MKLQLTSVAILALTYFYRSQGVPVIGGPGPGNGTGCGNLGYATMPVMYPFFPFGQQCSCSPNERIDLMDHCDDLCNKTGCVPGYWEGGCFCKEGFCRKPVGNSSVCVPVPAPQASEIEERSGQDTDEANDPFVIKNPAPAPCPKNEVRVEDSKRRFSGDGCVFIFSHPELAETYKPTLVNERCRCREGFYRHPCSGVCVEPKDCPPQSQYTKLKCDCEKTPSSS